MTTVGTEIGRTPRVDAVPKVTGQAVYTEDLPLPPGTLYGAILRSPYAHARLVSIDAQRAERLPGVHAVVTREHLGACPRISIIGSLNPGLACRLRAQMGYGL
jgi:CO/xanthine dehydrogenase Mo-binding subunit